MAFITLDLFSVFVCSTLYYAFLSLPHCFVSRSFRRQFTNVSIFLFYFNELDYIIGKYNPHSDDFSKTKLLILYIKLKLIRRYFNYINIFVFSTKILTPHFDCIPFHFSLSFTVHLNLVFISQLIWNRISVCACAKIRLLRMFCMKL